MSLKDQSVMQALHNLKQSAEAKDIVLEFFCPSITENVEVSCPPHKWCWCETGQNLGYMLGNSSFSLIISSGDQDPVSVENMMNALKYGAVPIILGSPILPFHEHIDWKKSVIRLPKSRATEILALLQSIRDEDVLSYRGNGRKTWEKYFSSATKVVTTLLDTLRNRLNLPARPVKEWYSPNVFNESFQPLWQNVPRSDLEEIVGPVEPPYPSDLFQRNFTSTTLDLYDAWNVHFDGDFLYPHLPYSSDLPGDAKFRGSEFGFRPIGGGAGGSGLEFSEALGGNRPREQFTGELLVESDVC